MVVDRFRRYTTPGVRKAGYIDIEDGTVVGIYDDLRYVLDPALMNDVSKPVRENCVLVNIQQIAVVGGIFTLTPDFERTDPKDVKFAIYDRHQECDWVRQIKVPFDVIDSYGNIVKDGTSKKAVPIR